MERDPVARRPQGEEGAMPRAVLYLRMSSDRQETSIPDQRAALLPYASQHGYDVVGEYADSGISGDATEKRVQFQRMIRDSTARGFDIILCWDLDRFGRFDSLEAGYWIKPLRDAGVRLVTIAQGEVDWESFAGRVVNVLQTEAKHAFLRDIARNSLRGRMKAASEGRWVTRVPFGYRKGDDGHLVPGPADEVETIRRIFELRREGCGYRTIAKRLNEDGAPSWSGKPWGMDSIRECLGRETYRGVVIFGKDKRGKYAVSAGGTVEDRGASGEPIRVEGAHPAIISEELWAAVHVTIPRGYGTGRPGNSVLGGLLVCGCCGAPMYAAGGERSPTYRCSTSAKGRGCAHCSVSRAKVDAKVVETIRDQLLGASYADLVEEIRDVLAEHSTEDERAALSRRVRLLEGKLTKATERMLDVPDAALGAARDRVRALDGQLGVARAELAAVPKRVLPDAEEVAASLWTLPDDVATGSAQFANGRMREFCSRIVLHFEDAGQDGRGRRMLWTGGEITLRESAEVWGFGCRRQRLGAIEFAA